MGKPTAVGGNLLQLANRRGDELFGAQDVTTSSTEPVPVHRYGVANMSRVVGYAVHPQIAHAVIPPPSPFLNAADLCAAEPCVQVSGLTVPEVLR
jgi:hypothetical protein